VPLHKYGHYPFLLLIESVHLQMGINLDEV
jgi:hypothetical protein